MMYYSCCSCRCSATVLVLLLYMCYCCTVLLLLLLLLYLRYVFAADHYEHGYYASHRLSAMCLRKLKLKYGFICFGSFTSTVSQLTYIRGPGGGLVPAQFLYDTYLYTMLLLSLLHQRSRRRFVLLSINSISCCSTNCFVAISI